jgi:dipeptidyl aminopeptidase/acylaminoacyl peptidase
LRRFARFPFAIALAVALFSLCTCAVGFAKPTTPATPTAPAAALPAQPPGERHPFTVHDMLAMDRLSEPRVSPDGQWIVFTVRETDLAANRGRTDLWLCRADGSGVRRLTANPAADFNPRWDDRGRIWFLSTRSGSAQVWVIDPSGGEARQATSLPLDVNLLELALQARAMILALEVYPGVTPAATADREATPAAGQGSARVYDELLFRHWDTWEDGRRSHLFTRPLDGTDAQLRDLMPDWDADAPTKPFGGGEELAVSADGAALVFTAKVLPGSEGAWKTDTNLWTVPLDGSTAPRCLTSANPAVDTQPAFSPDGRTVAYLAMVRPGYEADRQRIVLMDWPAGTTRVLTEAWDRSPGELAWAPDGKTIWCAADNLGQHAIFAVDVKNGAVREVVSEATNGSLNPVRSGVFFLRNSLRGPDELYFAKADGRETRKLTTFNDAKIAAAQFGEPEQFSYPGWNGDTVHGYLVRPVDFDPARRYPVVFLIHGGPQGSFGNDFHYRWNPQAYAGAGFAVVMVDFHGSTGYGQAFTDAINGHWGDRVFEDLMKGLDFALAKWSFLDGDKCVAAGASYGGYAVNWIQGHTDRFKALVSHDGNLDERMAYYDTEELWFPEWEHGGTPWDNPAAYARDNPVEFVRNWKTPMLVVHGEQDFRVVYTQGLSSFTALRRKGIPARLMILPDENHWVLKPLNSIQWHEEVLGWMKRWTQ